VNLVQILVFFAFSIFLGQWIPKRWRGWIIMGGSILAIFWMQPSTPIRNLDFWLPVVSIALTILVWAVTHNPAKRYNRSAYFTLFVVLSIIFVISITRYFKPIYYLTPSRPPPLWKVATASLLILAITILIWALRKRVQILSYLFIAIILLVFIVLKSPFLSKEASALLRNFTHQSTQLASAVDIPWLGFSYLAFRLIHVLRDYQNGKLPHYTLGDFVTYGIFFPSFPAGPIDRSQHFVHELHNTGNSIAIKSSHENSTEQTKVTKVTTQNTIQGSKRLIIGIFKKFVLADTLALIALNPINAGQTHTSLWMWVLLYAYGFRLYFDFSGYTDVAIGLAQLQGIQLPENFNKPYRTLNLTSFWNSWHITLAQWFRSYIFNPLTRYLRTKHKNLPVWVIIFIGQFSTMLLIGLWHGITINFALWGAWHGIGLFIQNRWSSWIHSRLSWLDDHSYYQTGLKIGGWLLTLNYVMLGWVLFVIPNPSTAIATMKTLFGF